MKIRHIMGEPGRFFVTSESTDGEHLVDLLEDACGCASFTCRNRAHKKEHGRNFRCKHISAAREVFLDDIIESLKENQLSR